MKHLHITHARLINAECKGVGITLNIKVPKSKLDETRKYIKERFQADIVNLTYKEYEPVR